MTQTLVASLRGKIVAPSKKSRRIRGTWGLGTQQEPGAASWPRTAPPVAPIARMRMTDPIQGGQTRDLIIRTSPAPALPLS